jgi:regulator of sirC expression with transglutaminase-like and TPR domain
MRNDLWTEADAGQETALRHAAHTGDITGALLAIEGAPEEHWTKLRVRLDGWGYAARMLAEGPDGIAPVDAVIQVLAHDAGFTGDSDEYGHPRNSYLTQVVVRRRGLPILLSCVYTIVGRAAGFDVSGVGMPGHFMVRVGDTLVDPFQSGEVRDEESCKELLREITANAFMWRSEFLEDTSLTATVERVLRNLVQSHQQRGEREMRYRAARLLAAVTPEKADTQLLYARITEDIGAHRMALDLYEQLMESFPNSVESRLAATRLGPLHTRTRMLN